MVFTYGRTTRDERGCPSLHCLLRGTRSSLSPWLTGLFHGGGDKSRRIHASQEAAGTHSSAASPSTKRGPRQQRHLRGEAGPGRGELGSGSAPPRVPAMGRCGGKGGELVRQACLPSGLWRYNCSTSISISFHRWSVHLVASLRRVGSPSATSPKVWGPRTAGGVTGPASD